MADDILGIDEEAGLSCLWVEAAVQERIQFEKTARPDSLPLRARALWREGRREEAICELEQFLEGAPKTGWAWLDLAAWCEEEHFGGRFQTFWEKHTAPVQDALGPVAVLALRRCALLAKAREVIEATLEKNPQDVDARLQLCELLVAEHRFDEAVAACRPPDLGENDALPVPLAAQSAWAEARRGLRLRALPRMQDVVKRDPEFAWGWELIGSWLSHERRWDEARKAVRRAAELRPGHGRIWVDWAHIEEADNNPNEAKRLLQEALRHDPSYGPAYLLLLEQSLMGDDSEETAALVAGKGLDMPPLFPLAARVLQDVKREQYAEAGELLTQLLRMEGLTIPFLRRVWDNAARLGGESLFVRTLHASIREPGVQPAAAVCWTQDHIETRRLDLAESLMEITPENGARRAAIDCYLKYLTGTPEAPLAARFLSHPDVDSLRQDDHLWGMLAGCLVVTLPYEAWLWGQDWRNHPKAEPWMLKHVARAALANRKLDDAFEVSREALAKSRHDSSLGFHRLVMALEAVLQNRTQEAREIIASLEGMDLPSWERAFGEIVRAAAAVQDASPEEVKEVWQERLERLIRNTSLRDVAGPQILAEVIRRLGKPGVTYAAPDPKELRSGWQRPSTWWERVSLGGMSVALVLFGISIVLALIAGQVGAGPTLSVTTVGLMAAAASLAGGCVAALFFSWKKSGQWRPALTFSAIGNGAILVLTVVIFATGGIRPADLPLVALSTPPPKKTTPASEDSDESPEGIMQGREKAVSAFDRTKPLALPASLLDGLPGPDDTAAETADGLTRAALALVQAERPGEAIPVARRALELDPDNALAHAVLGMAFFQTNDDIPAAEELQLAVEKDPELGPAWLITGYLHGLRKEWDQAISAFTKAAELQPQELEPWSLLVSAYRESGNTFGGESKLKEMSKVYPDSAAVWYQLGSLQVKEGMPKAGLVSLEKALALRPGMAEAWNGMGLACVRLKNRQKAIECFEKATELNPDLIEAWNNLAICQLLAGQKDQAVTSIEATLSRDPGNKRALVVLISARVLEGNYDKARETCQVLAGIDPALAAKIENKIPRRPAASGP